MEKEGTFEKKIITNSNTYNEELFKDNFWKTKNLSNSLSQTNNSINEDEEVKPPSSVIVKKEISQSEPDDGSDEEEDDDDYDYLPQKSRSKRRPRVIDAGKPLELLLRSYDYYYHQGVEEMSSNRKFRGLRYLSQKVKDIVLARQQTTYKEVADILTEDFNTLKKANLDFPV